MKPFSGFTNGHLIQLTKNQSTPIVQASQSRDAISFTFSDANVAIVTLGNVPLTGVADTNGLITVNVGNNPSTGMITLTRDLHGDCVEKDWHAWPNAATVTIGIIEKLNKEGLEQ